MRPIAITMALLLIGIFPSPMSAYQAPTSPYEPAAANVETRNASVDKQDPASGMKLGPGRNNSSEREKTDSRGPLPSLLTIGGSLAVVIGVFLIVAWLMRRASPRSNWALPDEAVEVLGRAHLAERQFVHLIRCGERLLLVSVTPNGAETLTEITAADEVERLSALCRQNRPGSSTASFRQVFQQLSWGGADE